MLQFFKHVFSFVLFYLTFIIHFQAFFNIKYKELSLNLFIYEKGSYVQVILLLMMIPALIFYLIYQWMYIKKIKKHRNLFSILFLEFLIVIETMLIFKTNDSSYGNKNSNVDDNILFLTCGIFIAFIMGFLLNVLMKRLFKDELL